MQVTKVVMFRWWKALNLDETTGNILAKSLSLPHLAASQILKYAGVSVSKQGRGSRYPNKFSPNYLIVLEITDQPL